VPLSAFTRSTKVASEFASRIRSPLYAPCPSPVSTLSPVGATDVLFDLRWLATTVNVMAPEVNVCAIGSRALNHTDSSLMERAAPFGVRASNSSTTRGRPPAMSLPATPPVWNVRIVNCVPGSPIDWAAMTPTASPSSIDLPVASERP